MARFLGAVQGGRGEATRLGGSGSGIRAQAQGWNVGVQVYGRADGDADVFDIYSTGGSHNSGTSTLLGSVRLVDGQPTFEPVSWERAA